jgi:hypothetical protein
VILVDPSLTTYTLEDLQGGDEYTLIISAFNKYGEGLPSVDLLVTAGQEPEQVSAPTVNKDEIYVLILWSAPFDNYSTIEGYQVMIKNSLLWVDATLACENDQWNLLLLVDTFCYMPMITLIDIYGLNYMDSIEAKVIAVNDRGSSIASDSNTVTPFVEDIPR